MDRFAHRLEPGEMDYRVDRMGCEHPAQALPVADIAFIEGEIPAGELPGPAQRLGLGIVIIVDHHDVAAGLDQLDAGVTADIAASARNEYCHVASS